MNCIGITRVVHVSKKGQTTIPKEFCDEHGIGTPGRVRFRETSDGEIVVEAVPHPDDKLGSRADHVREGEIDQTLRRLREENKKINNNS
jgi:antitoxin PrlF